MCLCCVLDDGNMRSLGKARDCVHVRWLAVQVNHDHGRRSSRHDLSDFVSAHQKSSSINVCEYNSSADCGHRFGGANKCEGWYDDLIARANPKAPEGEFYSGRSAIHAHAAIRVTVRRPFGLEVLYVVPSYKT